ncbi:MAG: U32 family peptidase [Geminicoccaceae bacterium]|nr:MAG: U32 family peptidase [Geminicoccaceae bacterium]
MELVCPAGTPAALRTAVDAGADSVYVGFRDETNARNFPGLNFSRPELEAGIAYAHAKGAKVLVAINTYPRAGDMGPWHRAVADAAALGADAVILADMGLCAHTAEHHPELRRHLSVQASASNPAAIRFYQAAFGVKRVVLPRVLTVDQIRALNREIEVETEVFVFGGLCTMAEGRCVLSGYVTGISPNKDGACSPASHVRYEDQGDKLVARLGGMCVDQFPTGSPAGYPTLCKGRYVTGNDDKAAYLFEEPTSLSMIEHLPALQAAGVRALKIEGRQRGRAYVGRVVQAFREAVDDVAAGLPPNARDLMALAEGGRGTEGAYRKAWQ